MTPPRRGLCSALAKLSLDRFFLDTIERIVPPEAILAVESSHSEFTEFSLRDSFQRFSFFLTIL